MKIEIVKHFQQEDEDFYGDFYVTVEVDGKEGRTYFQCNTDQAEAYADGYADALNLMGKNVIIETVCRADADREAP